MRDDILINAMTDIADDLVLEAQEVPDMKNSNSRIVRITLIAAIVVVLLAGTVLAATYKLWSPGLSSWFGADEAAQDALLDSGMTSLIYGEPVALENGLTIQVQQVLCDGSGIYVTARYSAPQAGWFTPENKKWATNNTHSSLTIGDVSMAPKSWGFDTENYDAAYMTWYYAGDCAGLGGNTATLRIWPTVNMEEYLETESEENAESIRNDPLILTNEVSISWTMDTALAISKTLENSITGEYDSIPLTIENIVLTPVSIRYDVTEGFDLQEVLYSTGVVLTDGTEIRWHGGSTEIPYYAIPEGEPIVAHGYYTLNETILDLDSVAGITYAAWANTPVDPEVGDVTVFVLPLK